MDTNVVVNSSQKHGRGLFSTRAFQPGEVVLRERPLIALQSLDNRQYVPTCGCCFGFVGSCSGHLKLLAEEVDRSELNHAVMQEEAAIPGAIFSSVVPCAMGCGELYCSVACRDQHWLRGHKLLCVGPIPDEVAPNHPLVVYKMHAVRTNEIFLLVADVIALIMTTYESNGGNLQAAIQPFRDFVQLPWWEVATNPDPSSDPVAFQQMLKGLVLEASELLQKAIGSNAGPCQILFQPEFFAAVIGMFEQNNVGIRLASPIGGFVSQLKKIGGGGGGGGPPILDLYVQQIYVPLLGKILQDWENAEQEEDDDEEKEKKEGDDAAAAMNVDDDEISNGCCTGDHNHHHHHHHQEGVMINGHYANGAATLTPQEILTKCENLGHVASRLFSDLDGTALLSLICCMNHSCAPNCEVRWIGGLNGEPVMAELVALQPITKGQELCQSYIKVELSLEERRQALKDYGFVCMCPKCTIEGGEECLA